MSETSNNTEYGPLADYAREAQRNAELSARLADAKNPVVSRLIQDALEASGAQLSEMTSEPKQLRELMTAHAALCHEIGLRVNDSEEMQAIDELVATSGDLVSVEQVSSARNEIAEAYADDVFAELKGMPEEIIDQLYSENICLELDGFTTKAPHDESGALQEQPSTVEDDPGDVLRVVEPGYDSTADVVSEQSSEADTDRSRSEAHMTIDYEAETLAIGRRADRARVSRLARDSGSQYVVDRARLLVAISENKGKELGFDELWGQAFGDREPDRVAMGQHRAWLKRLRYGNKRLVVHNGRTGPASAYQISDHVLSITHKNTQPSELYHEENQPEGDEVVDSFTEGWKKLRSSPANKHPEKKTEPVVTEIIPKFIGSLAIEYFIKNFEEEESAEINFGYIYSLARTIHSRVGFLRAKDVPAPASDIVQLIEQYSEEHSIDISIGPEQLQWQNNEGIEPLTMCRLEALRDLLTKEQLIDFIDEHGDSHPIVALLDYITTLSDEQLEDLRQIISGELQGTQSEEYIGGLSHRRLEVSHDGFVLRLPNGEIIEPKPFSPDADDQVTKKLSGSEKSKKPKTDSSHNDDKRQPMSTDTAAEDGTEKQAEQNDTDGATKARIESTESATPEWEHELATAIDEVVKQFEDDGLLDSDTVSMQILRIKTSSAKIGTEECIRKGLSARILKRSEAKRDSELPVFKAVCLVLQDTHQDIFRVSTRRKAALRIAEEKVRKHLDSKKS